MLDAKKLQTIDLLVQGIHYTEIKTTVGISRQTIYNWLEDEEFKAEYEKRRQEFINCTKNIFAFNAPKAARRIVKQIDSKNEKIANMASQYICDATCGKPTTKVENIESNRKENISSDMIEQAIKEIDNKDKDSSNKSDSVK